MKLTFDQIKAITAGAAYFQEENGLLAPKRFTPEQEELYQNTSKSFYMRAQGAAGIRLWFKTDSSRLFLKFTTEPGSSRKYFSVDVFANGKRVDCIDNYAGTELPQDYTKIDVPLGSFEKTVELGDGEKTVCIYLPWSVKLMIEELSLDDGAFLEPFKPKKKLLIFGDSITQGYDALRPSNRYAARLADLMGAEEYNKGIGGEKFFPPLAELKESFTPDYVTVAYGTNDWNSRDEETFQKNCKAFYTALSEHYPTAKIFAITPIWRKDHEKETDLGPFERVEEYIREAVKGLANVTLIPGFDLVPGDEHYFADLRVHPNDEGFAFQTENLYKAIREYL